MASGHNDSGTYIGQSTDVEVSINVAHDNVNGIEIELYAGFSYKKSCVQ